MLLFLDCGHLTSTSPLHNVIDRSLSPVVAANAHLKPSLKKRINSSSEEPIRKTSKLRRGWESSSASGSKSTSSPELPPTPPSPLCTKSPFKRNQLFRQSASVGFNSNLLNYSSNYQSVFDLTAEGDTTNNNPLLSTVILLIIYPYFSRCFCKKKCPTLIMASFLSVHRPHSE